MVRIIIALLFCFPVALSAQTYQQLSEKAIECIEKDSFHRAEELLLQALKLEPKNAKNALLFSNLGLVQRRLGEYDKALESYSFALNFAPLAVPILLDRAAIYMETGRTDRAYTDYCRVLDEAKQNKSDPVVNTGDILLELTAKKPADKRHERLKSAEIKTDDQSLLFIEFSHSEPLTDRDGKGVHGKPNT